MFPLCASCAAKESNHRCTCTDAERMLKHTWCTPELEAALNVGYRLVRVYEILHWEEQEKLNVENGEGGLFTPYINMFLRLKTESSGYPGNIVTEEEKELYVRRYLKREGVHLDPTRIERNPGLRSIGKLALNSFYGKFGQRSNMKKTAYITQYENLYEILTDQRKVIKDFHVLDEKMVMIEYCTSEEFLQTDIKTNVIIAAFCTSYARLKLWRLMQCLGERVLYHDTDSVIYSYFPHEWRPPQGEFLGDLTDELSCAEVGCSGCSIGHWIVEFVSCGAKNYAYKVNSGQIVCKVRGFSLNYAASQVLNLGSMREALAAWKEKRAVPEMVTVKNMILRDKLSATVYTSRMPKHYAVVYNKRVVLDDYRTHPYGY